jgi:hypothetical protein
MKIPKRFICRLEWRFQFVFSYQEDTLNLQINVMKTSNIFAYIELSKLVEELKRAGTSEKLKEKLRAQSAYFNILEPRYFSDSLTHEWEKILQFTKQKGVRVDADGRVTANAIPNTIESLSITECQRLAEQVFSVHDKLTKELF